MARNDIQHTGFHALDWLAMVLLIIGGLNWGLVGLMDLDVVAAVFGRGTMISRVVYILVGVAAVYGLYLISKMGRPDNR
ncbi:MAG: DUF378 domain-containing protein [Pseudomonadota bacterium]|nr:DUF378 domain-containing protein [Pseudomonadota bacterium]